MSSAEESPGQERAGEVSEPEAADEPSEPDVTPQSQALRRQQYAVGVGAAIISGFALTVSSLQHFPDLPESVPLIAGFLGATLVYWIIRRSLFPTEEELTATE